MKIFTCCYCTLHMIWQLWFEIFSCDIYFHAYLHSTEPRQSQVKSFSSNTISIKYSQLVRSTISEKSQAVLRTERVIIFSERRRISYVTKRNSTIIRMYHNVTHASIFLFRKPVHLPPFFSSVSVWFFCVWKRNGSFPFFVYIYSFMRCDAEQKKRRRKKWMVYGFWRMNKVKRERIQHNIWCFLREDAKRWIEKFFFEWTVSWTTEQRSGREKRNTKKLSKILCCWQTAQIACWEEVK